MTKSFPEIREKLRSMNESELRKILVLIFESLNLYEVTESHGTQEFGKDIVFYDKDKFGKSVWAACVVKTKDINQSSYDTVIRQVNECFRRKYPSISQGNVDINQVFVITNGSYKDNAKAQIADRLDSKRDVTFWTDTDIARHIEKNNGLLDILFGSNDLVKNLFNEHVGKNLGSDIGIRLLESDFDIHIDSVESFYIKVRAKAKQFEEERGEYLRAVDMQFTNIPTKFLPEIDGILSGKKFLLLHGIATSGKSTTLKKIGREFISQQHDGVVFYYELSKIVDSIKDIHLEDFIKADFLRVTNSKLDLGRKTEKGDYVLILLDGLDEIVLDVNRDNILQQISDLRVYSNVKVVLTSRSNDYLEKNSYIKENFDTYELMPLTTNDIVSIGSKIIGAPTQLEGFVKLVKHSELIRSFPKTPLTAILLAILFKEERLNIKELPKSITELYSKFVDVFLNRWDKGKGISEQFLFREKEFVLQKIAEYLHSNGMVTISESELTSFLDELFADRSMETYSSSQEFLAGVQARTSLLIKDDFDNSYRFFHLTIQEYLSVALLEHEGEDMLVSNFLDDWWLNPNIFYAGKKSHSFSILERISKFEVFPADVNTRLAYVVNTSKVLQAAHLLDNESRRKTLESMILIFDRVVSDLISAVIEIDDTKQRKRTILDIILWVRGLFLEFFSSVQFRQPLSDIGNDTLAGKIIVTDITQYCIFYCLAVGTRNSDYLYKFLVESKEINPRWYRIVDVDTKIKRMTISDRKMQSKMQSKAIRNGAYIYKQFSEVLKKHYLSVTGLRDTDLLG